jgi:membrane protein required for colicin V production
MFILVLLVWAVFRGLTRGLIMQLAILAAFLLGFYGALKLSDITVRQLVKYLNVDAEYLYLAAMGITFFAVFFLVYLFGNVLDKILDAVNLSLVNKLLGVLFSLAKTVLIAGVLLAFVDRIDHYVPLLPKYSREHSIFYKPFTSLARIVFPALRIDEPVIHETNSVFVCL